jgi:uncharacterized protein (TIGR03545 family)
MTESAADQNKVKVKKNKKKGPLRIEAIVPIVIIIALTSVYFKLFFDSNLASGLEYAGSVVHGAEVNIDDIDTSILGASIIIKNIQVTDKENPEYNMIKIEEISSKLVWDALLRGKFVVDSSAIKNVAFKSKRKNTGKILKSEERGSLALKKLEDGILDQSKEEFQGNILGDLASVLGGGSSKAQIEAIKETLVVEKTIDEVSADLDKKEEEWKQSIDSLTQKEELDSIRNEIKNIKVDKKKPWKAFKQVKPLVKKIKTKTEEFKRVSSEIKTMYNKYGDTIKNLDKLAEQDMKAIQGRMKLPDLDVADFSMGLFGKLFQEKVASIRKYTALAEEYLPKSVTDEAKAQAKEVKKSVNDAAKGNKAPAKTADIETNKKLIPSKRGKGENIRFPITTGYPLFWLKKAEVSSKSSASEFSGDIQGSLTNFTTEPEIVGKPAHIQLAGSFPKQGISGFSSDVYLRSENGAYTKDISATVESFPVDGMELSKSESLEFGFKKASGKTKLKAIVKGEEAQVALNNWFSNIDYQVDTKNEHVKDILTRVVQGIPVVSVNANATGPWKKLNWKVGSNLGKELSRGVKREIKGKIDREKDKYKKMVEDKYGPKKNKLMAKYNKIKAKMDKLLNNKKNSVDDAGNKALSDVKNKEKSGTQSKVKDKAKKLLKKFKF